MFLEPNLYECEMDPCKEQGPVGLRKVNTFGCFEILKVLMISEYTEQMCGSLHLAMPFL